MAKYTQKDIKELQQLAKPDNKLHFNLLLDSLSDSTQPQVVSYLREISRLIQLTASPILGMLLDKDLDMR